MQHPSQLGKRLQAPTSEFFLSFALFSSPETDRFLNPLETKRQLCYPPYSSSWSSTNGDPSSHWSQPEKDYETAFPQPTHSRSIRPTSRYHSTCHRAAITPKWSGPQCCGTEKHKRKENYGRPQTGYQPEPHSDRRVAWKSCTSTQLCHYDVCCINSIGEMLTKLTLQDWSLVDEPLCFIWEGECYGIPNVFLLLFLSFCKITKWPWCA